MAETTREAPVLDRPGGEPRFDADVDAALAELQGAAKKAGLPAGQIDDVLQRLLPHQVRTGKLATRFERWHIRASRQVFLLAALAVTVSVFQVVIASTHLWLISLELVMMLGACAWLAAGRLGEWHAKWFENRYHSEQLRIWINVLLLGQTDHDPRRVAQRLRFYESIQLPAAAHEAVASILSIDRPTPELEPLRDFLIQTWLANQRDWHRQTAHRKHSAARWSRWLLYVIFGLTFVAAMLHLLGVGHDAGHGLVASWITALAIVLPAWGGAIHGISRQLHYERAAVRSERMAGFLTELTEAARRCTSMDELRLVVADAAELMSMENFEWAAQIRLSPSELVA